MKLFNKTVFYIQQSHLIVAVAATLLAYQSLLITGNYDFRNYILLVIFSGTAFIYNLANLVIKVPELGAKTYWKTFLITEHSAFHIMLCILSFVGFIAAIIKLNGQEQFIVLLTGVCGIAYEMPFSKNNIRLKGFRNIPVFKNVFLAVVWAIATAWLPLAGKTGLLHPLDLTFIFFKRFLFLLPLCMVFDIRDQYNDLRNNIRTIPNQIGISATKNFALLAMMFFVIVIYLHKKSMDAISSSLLDFSVPLYISAAIASVFILMINETRKNAYYIFVIDGSMILQFLLVEIYLFISWR